MSTGRTPRDRPPFRLAFVVPRYGADVVGGAETLVRGLAEHLAAAGSAVEVLTTCARDHLSWKNVLPAGASRAAGAWSSAGFPVRLRDTRRHAWLQQRILRGSRLRPKEEARWVEESVGSTGALRPPHPPTGNRLRPGVLRPVPVRHDAPRRPARPRAGRPDPLPARRAVRPPRRRPGGVPSLPGLHLQLAARGSAGREALRDRRPARPASWDSASIRRRRPTPRRSAGATASRGPLLVYLGRKETGKNVPLLIEYALRYRAVRGLRPDARARRATARSPRRRAPRGCGTSATSTPPPRRRPTRPPRWCASRPSTSPSRSS